MDELVQYLVEELSFEGPNGVSWDQLEDYVRAFYAQQDSGDLVQQQQHHHHHHHQLVDRPFVQWVLSNLLALDQINVGHLDQNVEGHGEAKEEEVFQSATDGQGRKLSPEQATATLGDSLRVAASEETRWLALTGSYARPSKLTPMVYQVLQFVALRRGNGRTAVEVGQNFKIDQKAAHHYLKVLDGLGLIVKFNAATKNNTHLVVHRHFLSVSEPYKTATAKDPKVARVMAPRLTDDPDGDLYADQDQSALVLSQTLQPPSGAGAPFEGDATPNEHGLTPITYEQVRANRPLVRSRVLKVLRDAPSHVRPQVDIIFAINFRPVDKHNRRYLNTIIKQLGNDGLVQKGVVTTDGHHVGDGKQRSTPCVQLTAAGREYQETEDHGEEQQGGVQALTVRSDPVQGLDPFMSFGEEERTHRLLYTMPLFKQALNAIFDSRGAGMTLRDITATLRGLDLRLLDQQIQLYERSVLPPWLSDFAIHTGRESDGREGRFRFYSIAGYVERCLEDGLQVPENVVAKVDERLAGDWASLDGSARFRSLEQLDACTASLPLQGHGKVAAAAAKASSSGEPVAPKKRGRPRKNPEPDTASANGEPAAPKKKGRPRKNPEGNAKAASKPPAASDKDPKAATKPEPSTTGNISETPAPATSAPAAAATSAAATPSSAQQAPSILSAPSAPTPPGHSPKPAASAPSVTAEPSASLAASSPSASSAVPAPSNTPGLVEPVTSSASTATNTAPISAVASTSVQASLPSGSTAPPSSSVSTQVTTLAVNDSPQKQTAQANATVTLPISLTSLKPSSTPAQAPASRRQTKSERRPESHSQRVRENEVLATIQDAGGVIEETPVLIRAHVSYLKKIKNLPNDAKVPTCDKKTMTQTLNGLEYRGLIRRLTVEVSGKTGVPRQQKMVHLPHVTMKSPEMIAFLRTLRTAPAVDYNKPLLEGHNTSAVAAVFLSAKRHHSSHGESGKLRKRKKEGKRTSKSQDGKPRKKRKKRRQDITDENAAVQLPNAGPFGDGQVAFPAPQASSQLALMPAPQQSQAAAQERSKTRALQVAQLKEKQADEHGVKLAAALIKSLTATPQEKYDIESSSNLFQEFDQALLPKAVLMLQKNGVLVKIDSVGGRRVPGRNFLFSDKFEQVLRKSMPSSLLKDATSAAASFMDDSDERFSLIPEDGDMLALLHLVSFDEVELCLDTSLNSDKRDPTDYQTRKLDDESLENTVIVSPREDAALKRPSLERVVKLCDEHATLRGLSGEEAQSRLSSLDQHFESALDSNRPLSQLLSVFRDASVDGISCERAECFNPAWKHAIVAGLQIHESQPPLFALVGFDEPRFILCTPDSVAHWAVPHSLERQNERYFPQIWLDIRGRPVYDLVERYVHSVLGVLHTCPGLTVPELCQKLSPVFNHAEMLNLLGMMQQSGLVEHLKAQHQVIPPMLPSLQSCWRVLPDLQWYLS